MRKPKTGCITWSRGSRRWAGLPSQQKPLAPTPQGTRGLDHAITWCRQKASRPIFVSVPEECQGPGGASAVRETGRAGRLLGLASMPIDLRRRSDDERDGRLPLRALLREAGGLQVDKDDLKRYTDFVNTKVADLMIRAQAVAKGEWTRFHRLAEHSITKVCRSPCNVSRRWTLNSSSRRFSSTWRGSRSWISAQP